jgi:hypothetical protein
MGGEEESGAGHECVRTPSRYPALSLSIRYTLLLISLTTRAGFGDVILFTSSALAGSLMCVSLACVC